MEFVCVPTPVQTRARVDAICCCFFCVHGSLSPVSLAQVFHSANMPKHTRWLESIAQKWITHFHGSGAFRLIAEGSFLRVAMSAEQTHQRLGVAEGVIRELQEHLQRVSAGTSSGPRSTPNYPSRNESSPQSNRYEITFSVGVPKSWMPDTFGKKTDPSWRTWSYLRRDFVGPVQSVMKQAMKNAEKQEAGDLCVEPSRLRCDERNGPGVATFFNFQN